MKFFYFFILFSVFFFPRISFALDCYAVINGNNEITETVRVNDIILPESAKDGEIIWRSDEYTRTVMCNNANLQENVYFYPFPRVSPSDLPKGMVFGITYNGASYDLTSSLTNIKTDIVVPKNGSKTGVIKVQVYIKKNGTISGGYDKDLAVYQLDGVGGLNNSSNANNFKFYLSNLKNVATGVCSTSFSGLTETKSININDNLISNGQLINSIGSASVSCTPANILANRKVNMNLYTMNSSSDQLFRTDKNGLYYQLLTSGVIVSPSNTSSSPVKVTFSLNGNGQGSSSFDQKIFLTDKNEDWLYSNNTTTATSKNPNLGMSVQSFE